MRKYLLMSALVAASGLTGAAHAESRSTVSINGKTITVTGDGPQSVSAVNSRAVIAVGSLKIEVNGDTLSMGDRSVALGSYDEMEIAVIDGEARITVDGRIVEPE